MRFNSYQQFQTFFSAEMMRNMKRIKSKPIKMKSINTELEPGDDNIRCLSAFLIYFIYQLRFIPEWH